MEPWASALMIVLLALAIDAVLGDPPNRVHPLRWMGNAVDRLDRRISRGSPAGTRLKGFLSYAAVASVSVSVPLAGLALVREHIGEAAWVLASAVLLKLTFAIFSFRRHCEPIEKDLLDGDTESAAARTQMIVSRDTEGMDEAHISSSCTETVSENLADSVCSPLFYLGLFGLSGAVLFRCANLMDAMWGYLDDRYRDLGYFVAKLDDVLGYATSRLSVPFVMLAAFLTGADARSAWQVARQENHKTPSPNSGWPMAAAAGALGIRMEKEGWYTMGNGALPAAEDISRCYRLVELSSVLFVAAVAIPLYALVGIHVQIYMENALLGLIS